MPATPSRNRLPTKRLVVCLDGTWSGRESENGGGPVTNVVKTSRAVLPRASDGVPQATFYDEGVGMEGGLLSRLVGGATGAGISKNIADGYRFLVDNYEDRSDIFLFGFSRGAYTARSVVGMIRKCGLLRKSQAHLFPKAYEFYRGPVKPDDDEAKEFRAKHSRTVDVHFLGVWDTVGSLGIPLTPLRFLTARHHQFHDVELSRIVKNAFHAVAIDERRKHFQPTLWSTKRVAGQRVDQEWFAGDHSDVGGGTRVAGLSDVAFLWMKERAEEAGLDFDEDYVREACRPDPRAKISEPSFVWRPFLSGWRHIGHPDHLPQGVHATAVERYKDLKMKYNPPNLVAYLQSPPRLAPVSTRPAAPDAAWHPERAR